MMLWRRNRSRKWSRRMGGDRMGIVGCGERGDVGWGGISLCISLAFGRLDWIGSSAFTA